MKKNKGGRPTKYKPEYCELLKEHYKEGLSFDSFGGVVCASRETLYNWTEKYPEFFDTKKQYEPMSWLFWEKMGRSGAAGKIPNFNAAAWIFNMKNRMGWRDKHEISTEENTQIILNYKLKDKDEN